VVHRRDTLQIAWPGVYPARFIDPDGMDGEDAQTEYESNYIMAGGSLVNVAPMTGGEQVSKKIKRNLKDGSVIADAYKEGRIVRMDFIYGNELDHSIIYNYE